METGNFIAINSPTKIGSKIRGSTSGSILFIDSNGKLAEDNSNAFYDSVNGFFGFGTNVPDVRVEVQGEIRVKGGSATVPAIIFGNAVFPNQIGWASDFENEIWMIGNNAKKWIFRKEHFESSDSNGPHIHRVQESNTIYAYKANQATGIGFVSPNILCLTTNGVIAVEIDASQVVKTISGRISNTDRYTSNQTLNSTNHIVLGDTDGGAFTITFEAGVDGTHHKISNVGNSGNALTLTPDGAELLVGDNANFDLLDGETLDLHYETSSGWVG